MNEKEFYELIRICFKSISLNENSSRRLCKVYDFIKVCKNEK